GAKLTKDNYYPDNTSALVYLSNNTAAGSLAIRNGATLALPGNIINAGTVILGPGSTLQTGREGQFATTVLGFSSQYGTTNGSAEQALGTPNTYIYYNPSTAWAPAAQNGTLEFLTLGFATPVSSDGVTVRETAGNGNGFVYQVDVVDTSD